MSTSLLSTCCGKVETILGANSARILNEFLNEPHNILNTNSVNSLTYFLTYVECELNQPSLFINHNGNLLLNWIDKYNNDIEIEFKGNQLICYCESDKSDYNIPLNKKSIQIFLTQHK